MSRAANLSDLRAGPLCFLGLGFGAGLAPVAPGTFGTLIAVPLYLAAFALGETLFMLITLAVIATGAWICGATARQLDAHDHGAIVWDEIAGFFVTMALVAPTAVNVVTGFLLFRLFDILKPWPILWLDQRVDGGVGIMLDDLVAGLIAGILLLMLNLWNPGNLFF